MFPRRDAARRRGITRRRSRRDVLRGRPIVVPLRRRPNQTRAVRRVTQRHLDGARHRAERLESRRANRSGRDAARGLATGPGVGRRGTVHGARQRNRRLQRRRSLQQRLRGKIREKTLAKLRQRRQQQRRLVRVRQPNANLKQALFVGGREEDPLELQRAATRRRGRIAAEDPRRIHVAAEDGSHRRRALFGGSVETHAVVSSAVAPVGRRQTRVTKEDVLRGVVEFADVDAILVGILVNGGGSNPRGGGRRETRRGCGLLGRIVSVVGGGSTGGGGDASRRGRVGRRRGGDGGRGRRRFGIGRAPGIRARALILPEGDERVDGGGEVRTAAMVGRGRGRVRGARKGRGDCSHRPSGILKRRR